MIISHKYKFIFLKTKKTAGTSIEIALSKFCGEEDIITPISPRDERLRSQLGYQGPQNYLYPFSYNEDRKLLKSQILNKKRCHRFINHAPARKIKKCIDEGIWQNYYKFCLERNPWDRVVSFYYWRCRQEPRPTLSEFMELGALQALKKGGFEIYTIEGKIVVDRVCLYEDLTEELQVIQTLLGLPEKIDLPTTKSRFRKDKRHYREIFDEEQRAEIAKLFSQEISLFGYEF